MPDDDDCMQINEWRTAVKNEKSSTSFKFSRRDCVVHERVFECERMVDVLVQFCNAPQQNTIIAQGVGLKFQMR